MRTSGAGPLSLLLLLAILVAGFSAIAPAAAQQDVRFLESTARPDFPKAITFELTAESSAPIEQVDLYWHVATAPALTLEEPEVAPGTRVNVSHTVDMTINYRPPGTEISYWWRVTDARGNVSKSDVATFTYMDERQSWRTRSEDLVTIHWYRGSERFGSQVLTSAVAAIERLSDRFKIDSKSPINILIYGDDEAFSSALAANSAEWIGGAAYPEYGLVLVHIAPNAQAPHEIGRTIPHEISHLITYRATRNPYNTPPSWLDEGLATYNQVVEDDRLEPILRDAVDNGTLIPIQALSSSFPLDPDQALLSYAESNSVVTFIVDHFGDDALADLVASFKTGVSYNEAVQSTLDLHIKELDARWKAWLGYQGDAPDLGSAPAGNNSQGQSNETVLVALVSGFACLGVIAFGTLGGVILLRRRG